MVIETLKLTNLMQIYKRIGGSCEEKLISMAKPLVNDLHIPYFSYQFIETTGRYSLIANRFDVLEYYLSAKSSCCDFISISPSFCKRDYFVYFISDQLMELNRRAKNVMSEIEAKFKFKDLMVIVKKNLNYTEIFSFGISSVVHEELTFLGEFDLIEKFIDYFLLKGVEILKKVKEAAINLPGAEALIFKEPRVKLCDTDNLFKTDYDLQEILGDESDFLGKIARLSSRERECVYWVSQGKTADEIGILLNISKKTVELHKSNIISKLGKHYNFARLVYLVGKYNLLENK